MKVNKKWEIATLRDLDIFMDLFCEWDLQYGFNIKGDRRYFKSYFKGNKRQRKKALKKVVSNVFHGVLMPYARKIISNPNLR